MNIKRVMISFCLLWFALTAIANNRALVLTVDGAISPAVDKYIADGITEAVNEKAQAIILKLDTPGGLVTSTRKIVSNILASPIPFITYVAPSGAHAASAGTFIVYASAVAAMAPGTNLGAATPVRMGGGGGMPGGSDQNQDSNQEKLANKATNDAAAYIRSLAEIHGRDSAWAEAAVREGKSLSAEEAIKRNVVDLKAVNIRDLLTKIDGKSVIVADQKQILATKNLTPKAFPMNWRLLLLSFMANPNVAYVFLLLGVYGLFFELANPGLLFPGIVGALCLLVGLYSLHVIPINYAGLALLFFGIILMVAEVITSSFGILGIAGVVAFFIGSIMLTDVPGMQLHWPIIIAMTALSAGFFMAIVGMFLRARKRKKLTGIDELQDATVVAQNDFQGQGTVTWHGETWRAYSDVAVQKGQTLTVTKTDGLLLFVSPKQGGH